MASPFFLIINNIFFLIEKTQQKGGRGCYKIVPELDWPKAQHAGLAWPEPRLGMGQATLKPGLCQG